MTVTLLGFSWDKSASYARGPALASDIIRAVLRNDASSPYSLSGTNALELISAYHFPTMPEDGADCRLFISQTVRNVTKAQTKPLSLGGDHLIVARDKHLIIGVGVLSSDNGLFEIKNLAVLKSYQNRGLARLLITELKKLAKQMGAEYLEVGTGNSSLIPFMLY